jgi:NAD(P)-dependent dehydrogenase (short-subunit alcohol dehydrogenase family)
VAAGGHVVVVARRAEQGREAVRALGAHGSFVQVDVRDESSVERMVEETLARWGRLDLAVNAAGIGGDMAPIESASLAAFDDVLSTNARGVYLAMRFRSARHAAKRDARRHREQHAEQVAPELVRARVAEHPIGRMASEAEIAAAMLYLASPQAAFVVGASLPVDGGFSGGLTALTCRNIWRSRRDSNLGPFA